MVFVCTLYCVFIAWRQQYVFASAMSESEYTRAECYLQAHQSRTISFFSSSLPTRLCSFFAELACLWTFYAIVAFVTSTFRADCCTTLDNTILPVEYISIYALVALITVPLSITRSCPSNIFLPFLSTPHTFLYFTLAFFITVQFHPLHLAFLSLIARTFSITHSISGHFRCRSDLSQQRLRN